MFHNSVLHNEYKGLARKLYALDEFLVRVMETDDLGARLDGKAVCFAPCTANGAGGESSPAMRLLRNVKGLELAAFDASPGCCGWGGTLAARHEAMAVEMGRQRLAEIAKTGARYVISAESGCLMHLKGIHQKALAVPAGEAEPAGELEFLHLADVLVKGVEGLMS
jgi:L-lactate dehydrogenase complex protein LldE